MVPHHPGSLELLSALKLRSAPATVVGSVFTLSGWVISALGVQLLNNTLSDPGWLPRLGLLVVSAPVALLVTSVCVRPLAPLFSHGQGLKNHDLLGQTCEISTTRVDGKFGRGSLIVQGQDLMIEVRCDRPDHGLGKGAQALLISHDPRRDAFVVEPLAKKR